MVQRYSQFSLIQILAMKPFPKKTKTVRILLGILDKQIRGSVVSISDSKDKNKKQPKLLEGQK